jgi:hypothetical protein
MSLYLAARRGGTANRFTKDRDERFGSGLSVPPPRTSLLEPHPRQLAARCDAGGERFGRFCRPIGSSRRFSIRISFSGAKPELGGEDFVSYSLISQREEFFVSDEV